jgi:hypothetical protein
MPPARALIEILLANRTLSRGAFDAAMRTAARRKRAR